MKTNSKAVGGSNLEENILSDQIATDFGKNNLSEKDEVWLADVTQRFNAYVSSTKKGVAGKGVVNRIEEALSL